MYVTRRQLLESLAALGVTTMASAGTPETPTRALDELRYDQVEIHGRLQKAQQANVAAVLLGLNEDSLLKPFRAMAGRPAPGTTLGGWYEWKPDFDFHHDDAGFAPASTFGQWTSALSRLYAASCADGSAGTPLLAERVHRLHDLLRQEISPAYFAQTRFPAYTYDKLVCGLIDAHQLAGDAAALETLDRVTDAATASLPGHAVPRETQWLLGRDQSWMWDESFTLPENLYRATAAGAGPRYHRLARAYLEDSTFFLPLARGQNALSDKHAYSSLNALCSAMQAFFVDGSTVHLEAAKNAFRMVEEQSFVTGGWGPDELFRKPGYNELAASLSKTHNTFEVPCGSFAHMKLTRYLLRATRDGRYGDSMERILHNATLGALPLEPDGRSFYYADYNLMAKRIYSVHRWPCCSGTLPQLAADYGINSYLREPGALWINLYQASTVHWTEGASNLVLEQIGDYPATGQIRFRLLASAPTTFALRLRIPAWAGDGSTLRVNNALTPITPVQGFATVHRLWQSGDTVELILPMSLRLEALPANGGAMHLETVALLRGPQVLFAIRQPAESGALSATPEDLLKAEQTGAAEWRAETTTGPHRFVPWTDLGSQTYTTYVHLTAPGQSFPASAMA